MNARNLVIFLLSAGAAGAQTCREMRIIRVPVAAMTPAAVAAAQREAAWILRSLRATVVWGPERLLVRILPEPLTSDSTADAMGMAMRELARGFGKRELDFASQRHLVFNADERKVFASGRSSVAGLRSAVEIQAEPDKDQ
jgi:hypothetical protein